MSKGDITTSGGNQEVGQVKRQNLFHQDRDNLYLKEKEAFATASTLRNTMLKMATLIAKKLTTDGVNNIEDLSLEELSSILNGINANIPIDTLKDLTNICSKTYKNMQTTYFEGFVDSSDDSGLMSFFKED